MNARLRSLVRAASLFGALSAGCGQDDDPVRFSGEGDAGTDALQAVDAGRGDQGMTGASTQAPPQGRGGLEAWLAQGHYKSWKCEREISPPRPNGAHGRTRVCSNELMGAHGAGEYPVGAAAVKELYSNTDEISGHAVSLKIAGGATGATWYWYEKIGSSVVADGVNVSLCAGCHSLAGTDSSHQGHDFVYVQISAVGSYPR